MTADEFIQLMEDVGYTNIKKLEWVDFQTKDIHTTSWDFCEGPVIRSVQYDRRNQEFLKRNCHKLNLMCSADCTAPSSTLAENTFPSRDLKVRSAIIQGYKHVAEFPTQKFDGSG